MERLLRGVQSAQNQGPTTRSGPRTTAVHPPTHFEWTSERKP